MATIAVTFGGNAVQPKIYACKSNTEYTYIVADIIHLHNESWEDWYLEGMYI